MTIGKKKGQRSSGCQIPPFRSSGMAGIELRLDKGE